ncbi:hypothetical protein GCM10007981_09700 [Thermocladium modestius]|uniref:Transcription factor CBF/NF-Y/archaeal histone domain-containing protein n=1 Tax=Thermocladium modestius TaxID=62609 RepID=A0A830GU53_9CREN|nr:histone family protein [Thermocladium modestius]GGP20673.1 hypothetical protein GCM10007981_09700 [Thermocladium modestius]
MFLDLGRNYFVELKNRFKALSWSSLVMPEIPLAPVDRIFKKAGAERVGEDAVQALRDILESIAYDLANRSIEMSKHANRKTITAEDVRAVVRIIRCVPLSV